MRQASHPDASEVTMAGVLAALGDPVRLSVVRTLSDGAEHLSGDFDTSLTKSTLSHHLKTLREAGVIFSRPEGTRCYNSLRPEFIARFSPLLTAILDDD